MRHSPLRHRLPRLAALACLLGILLGASACQRIEPVRTLPSWVRGVYIPMFTNETYEPGLEELATRFTQEAFLADGRLRIVPERDADLVLKGSIESWTSQTDGTSGDKVRSDESYAMTIAVALYDPFDDKTPRADLGLLKFDGRFNVDTRSSNFEPEPDRKERLMRDMAREIVFMTINGYPLELRDAAPGVTLPKIQELGTISPEKEMLPSRGRENF